MPPSPRQPPDHGPGGSRWRTAWGTRFFAQVARDFPASTPPAERRLVRCVYTVFRTSDRMLDHMEDADVWSLALAVERLKTASADAIDAGIDGCYVRTLMALAFLAARDVLEVAKHLVDVDDMFRAESDLRRDTPQRE